MNWKYFINLAQALPEGMEGWKEKKEEKQVDSKFYL